MDQLPGVEGKAGMAVVVTTEPLDLKDLLTKLRQSLPPYALPLFLRTVASIDTTGHCALFSAFFFLLLRYFSCNDRESRTY